LLRQFAWCEKGDSRLVVLPADNQRQQFAGTFNAFDDYGRHLNCWFHIVA
jgi:hypothetical protein